MTIHCKYNSTALLTPRRSARRVVLAGRFRHAIKAADQFRQLGWEVHTLPPESSIHEAAATTKPHAIVLPELTGDESGYLACAKLMLSQPKLKVVLVGSERSARRERFAEFVGATFVTEIDGACEMVAAAV